MTQDEQHLNLLAIFHYVLGGITALFACIFLIHLAMGVGMVSGAFNGEDAPPQFFGWLFILFPSVAILFGWTLAGFIIAAGRKLKQRRAYTFCLVIASCECLIMPLGTVLGIFTLIMLMKEPVKAMFGEGTER